MELFRYRKFEFGLNELDESYLWFSNPKDLNDLFDCNPRFSDIERIEDIWLALAEMEDDFKADPAGIITRIKNDVPDTPEAIKQANDMLRQQIQITIALMGVCCFADKPDNLLMWSHYAGNYGGICIKYESTGEPRLDNHVKPVRYVTHREEVSLSSLGEKSSMNAVGFTKSTDWAYEKEWRTNGGPIFPGHNRKLSINPSCIKAIYCGPKMFGGNFESVLELRNKKYPNVEIFRGRTDENSYSLVFDKI